MSDYKKFEEALDWEKFNGVVPVIVQNEEKEVLTLGWVNPNALRLSLETGLMHYYSNSQKRIRMKGEISGNFQYIKGILSDCDNDSLLITVRQKGPACHTGTKSCFNRLYTSTAICAVPDYSLIVLKELEETIMERKNTYQNGSYTCSLFKKGKEEIYKKFGEEAVEVLVSETKEHLEYEIADMLYHLLVLMRYEGIELKSIMAELKRRMK